MSQLDFVTYDVEIAPNLAVLGFRPYGEPPIHIVLEAPMDGVTAERIENMIGNNRELVGYFNSTFDTYLLNEAMQGAPARRLYENGQTMIKTRNQPAWQVARQLRMNRSPFSELDLQHYTPRGRLKQYEGRMALPIVDLPFDPDQPLLPEQMATVHAYLDHDLLATESLRLLVEPEVQARLLLEQMFDAKELTKKSASNVAASIIVDAYLRDNPEYELADIRHEALRARDCEFDFHVPGWVMQGIRGTIAEQIARQIDGTTFRVVDGKRNPPEREWPSVIRLGDGDGLEAEFGLGGIHSKDQPCHYSGVSFDVQSLYPQIIMHPECTPSHIDEGEFHRIYGQIIQRRLQAKREGDKRTSNALKLVLNSCFGAFNYAYSPLYSPDAFVNITVSGQLCLLALADRLHQRNVTEVSHV